MRELWQTGWMHNRVRMITASFLVKHLRIDWRQGETWFWLDANLANNGAGWQWVAECGADASPYFRIFNPMTQGRKFDPNGNYVRRWCPELARLPHLFIMRHSRLHLKCWLKRASNLERHILTRSSIIPGAQGRPRRLQQGSSHPCLRLIRIS
jgi:deoxyribodipyrimidine photolyase